jgi:hypothetical protein
MKYRNLSAALTEKAGKNKNPPHLLRIVLLSCVGAVRGGFFFIFNPCRPWPSFSNSA